MESFSDRTMNRQTVVNFFRSLFKGKSKIYNILPNIAQFDSRYSKIMFEQHLRYILFRDKNQHIIFCILWYQIKMFITKTSWDEPKLLWICKINVEIFELSFCWRCFCKMNVVILYLLIILILRNIKCTLLDSLQIVHYICTY